jgi:hypothetical protein
MPKIGFSMNRRKAKVVVMKAGDLFPAALLVSGFGLAALIALTLLLTGP